MVDQTGLEPVTSSLQTRRSSQVSYWPFGKLRASPFGQVTLI